MLLDFLPDSLGLELFCAETRGRWLLVLRFSAEAPKRAVENGDRLRIGRGARGRDPLVRQERS